LDSKPTWNLNRDRGRLQSSDSGLQLTKGVLTE
jgi:hypothetical protein